MDTQVESQLLRLSRIKDEMARIQRHLSNYNGVLRNSWTGRDGQVVQLMSEQMEKKSRSLGAELADMRSLIIQAQTELEEEAAMAEDSQL